MPSAHGYFTIDHDWICGVDDSVNDRIGDWAVIVRISVDTVVPALGMVLRTENHRPLNTRFNDLQQIIALIRRQAAD